MGKKVFNETEIKVLEKGLDFAPVQKILIDKELRKYFEGFSAICVVSATLVLTYLRISVKHQPLDLNLYGNHQKAM